LYKKDRISLTSELGGFLLEPTMGRERLLLVDKAIENANPFRILISWSW